MGHHELVAVQAEGDVARERHHRERDLRLGLGLHSEERDEAFGRQALPHVFVRNDHSTRLAEILVAAGMIEVPVGVQQELDRFGRELGDRRLDLGRERRELVVDHEHRVLADRHAEVPARAGHHVDGVGELLGLDLDLGEVLLGRCRGGEERRGADCEGAKKIG